MIQQQKRSTIVGNDNEIREKIKQAIQEGHMLNEEKV